MIDAFPTRLAHVLTNYSVPIQKGDFVVIKSPTIAEPLVEALVKAVLARGGHPHVSVYLPNTEELMLQYASDEQLTFQDPLQAAMAEKLDVIFRVIAFDNPKNMAHIAPQRVALLQKGAEAWYRTYRRRRAAGELRWNVAPWPTVGMAQQAEMGVMAYREFVYKACGLHHNDPVAYWQGFRDRQLRYLDWLDGKRQLVMRGPGIDLSMSIEGRTWLSAHGEVNFPDGEIFTGPVEDTVNGSVEFNFPTTYQGRTVDGVRLVFQDGKVVEASAKKGEDFLYSKLDTDAGARFLGEIAIGTNDDIQQFTGNTLFDEKIGGTIHMALGQAYAESGAKNQSIVHWDMVHGMRDGGEIEIDGEIMYRNGEFLI